MDQTGPTIPVSASALVRDEAVNVCLATAPPTHVIPDHESRHLRDASRSRAARALSAVVASVRVRLVASKWQDGDATMRISAMRLWLIAGLGAVLATSAPHRVVWGQASGATFLIANVRVFDGERVRPGLNVLVEGGVIRAVTTNRQTGVPVVDGAGATLLPGLLDAHAHPAGPPALQESLRFGVTTVLGMGVTTTANEETLRAAATGRLDVADYRSAGTPATAPDAHGTFGPSTTVAGPVEADAFVAARKSAGADYLKILLNGVRTAREGIPNLNEDTVRALARAAHARGMLVVAHVESLNDVRVALGGGVDGLAHLWRENGPTDDLIPRIAAQRLFVVPTVVIPDALVEGSSRALAEDTRLRPFLSATVTARLLRPPSGVVLRDSDISWRLNTIGRLHAAGVVLLAGTDADDGTRSASGVHIHRELELLVKSGLTPADALASATAKAADAFRLRDRGRVAVGQRADLLLVRGDPTVDITATRDILRVWRSGLECDRPLSAR